jgi:hypothetical protein
MKRSDTARYCFTCLTALFMAACLMSECRIWLLELKPFGIAIVDSNLYITRFTQDWEMSSFGLKVWTFGLKSWSRHPGHAWRPHFYSVQRGNFHWMAMIPLWETLLVCFGIAVALWVRCGTKPGPNHCSHCGYDLRATPDRCPECGNIPTSADLTEAPPLAS